MNLRKILQHKNCTQLVSLVITKSQHRCTSMYAQVTGLHYSPSLIFIDTEEEFFKDILSQSITKSALGLLNLSSIKEIVDLH